MVISSLSEKELISLFEESRTSPRKRAVRIFQGDFYEGPQIGLNVIQPESYVRPHFRYADESVMVFSGRLCSLWFNSNGEIINNSLLTRENPYLFLPKRTFQSVVSLEEDSAIWMVVQGPHDPKKFSEYLPSAPDEKGNYMDYFEWLKKEANKLR